MLALFLLVGCTVVDSTLQAQYEEYGDYDASYAYNDDDDEDKDIFPGSELKRLRRYQDTTWSRYNENADDTLKQIMDGRNIEDWNQNTSPSADTSSTISTNNLDIDTSLNVMTAASQEYDSSVFSTFVNDSPETVETEYDGSIRMMPTRSHQSGMPTRSTIGYPHIQARVKQEKKELLAFLNSMMSDEHRLTTTSNDTIQNIVQKNFHRQGGGNPSEDTGENTAAAGVVCYTTTAVATTSKKTKKTTLKFDIEKFLNIITNLTYDYYTNLTDQVNNTLIKMGIPTCATPTTTTTPEPTTTTPRRPIDYSGWEELLMGKCFVCGLEDTGIPYNANCADAFAGDFLPLVPQNPMAKGQIARYRKYCRYKDVRNYQVNETMPRSLFGRWTGGCSVRWTDLSGVYTQRTCRNRNNPTLGKHFASKRMAKLELTLSREENGCIISPVAALLPLSRGISLFARFHACVCTGNWCNRSSRFDSDVWMTAVIAATVATVI